MKNIIICMTIMISTLSAVDLRIARGSYDTDMAIKSFMQHNTTNDITVFSLNEPHKIISQSAWFYYANAALYTSNSKRQTTEFANFAASYTFPLVGSVNDMTNAFIDMVSVDGDYKAVGFDINFGLGYDLLRKGRSYLGIALNTGATLPTINAENLTSKADLVYDLMESWDLDMRTYKIGPSIKANLALYESVNLYGSIGLGFQKARVKSGLFKSSIDVNGDYSALDVGVRYQPKGLWSLPKNIYFLIGHSMKRWNVDSATVNLYNFFQADVFRPFTTQLKSHETYIGAGYQF